MSGAHAKRQAVGRALRLAGWAVVVLVILSLVAFIAVGANGPEDPSLGGLPGFGEVAFRVTRAEAAPTSAQYCALLAADDTQRAKGLMGRRDLAGFDGMLFRFDQDHSGTFFMRDVPVALSIAWFDGAGAFVSATDMEPCPDDVAECPQYSADRPYRWAIETLKGGLAPLGIGPGSTLDVGGPCPG